MNDLKKTHKNIILTILFSSLLAAGLLTFRDYSIHIEEKFHRSSGLYWLHYLLNFTEFDSLKMITLNKLKTIGDYTLSSATHYNKYGIIFDVPAAFLEIIFKIENSKSFYQLRHCLSFILFFLSSIFFYKILMNRFNNFNVCIVGTLLYVLSPRIYGDSFLYKDILFLSILTFTIFYTFKCFDKFNYKNLTILALLSSICISTRIIGIFIPITFSFIIFLSFSLRKKNINFYKKYLFFIIFLIIFLIIHWPYLWSSPINNFLSLFTSLKYDIVDMKILFNNEFISSRVLPYKYIPYWIGLTTPIPHLILSIFGIFICAKKSFVRLISIKENSKGDDWWNNENEKKDFFIFFSFFSIILFLVTFNIGLYNGWRIIYFINIFFMYFSALAFYSILSSLKKNNLKLFLNFFILLSIILILLRMIAYHPYQSIYFNILATNKVKNSYEIDYYGLAGSKFLNDMIAKNPKENIIKIAVASHTPLQRSLESLSKEESNKIRIIGQEYSNADYIFKNNISEVNSRFNHKYDVPKNFVKIEEYIIDGILIYEVFKSNKKK